MQLSDSESNGYFSDKLDPALKPLDLIPYYDVSAQHFQSPETSSLKSFPTDYKPSFTTLHPHLSLTGFQHQLMIGCKCGQILKWNSNIGGDWLHQPAAKLYGGIFQESKPDEDGPLEPKVLNMRPKGMAKEFQEESQRPYVWASE